MKEDQLLNKELELKVKQMHLTKQSKIKCKRNKSSENTPKTPQLTTDRNDYSKKSIKSKNNLSDISIIDDEFNQTPSSISQKMNKAYDNLIKSNNNDNTLQNYLKSTKLLEERKKNLINEQEHRINNQLHKDAKIEYTFQPEHNKRNDKILDKQNNNDYLSDKSFN